MSRHTYNPFIAEIMGKKLLALRKKAGLTQRELAQAVGFGDGSTITRYEKGDTGMSIESLCIHARYMQVEPSALLPTLAELDAVIGLPDEADNA